MNADIIDFRRQSAEANPVTIVEMSRISSFSIPDRTVKTVDETGKIREIAVRDGFFRRAIPSVGDYLIRYRDGHVSHAPPQKLREGGYVPLSGPDLDFRSAPTRRPAPLQERTRWQL